MALTPAANLSFLFKSKPFLERFRAAKDCGECTSARVINNAYLMLVIHSLNAKGTFERLAVCILVYSDFIVNY